MNQEKATINAAAVDSSVAAAASSMMVSPLELVGIMCEHPDPQLLPLGECSRKIALADRVAMGYPTKLRHTKLAAQKTGYC